MIRQLLTVQLILLELIQPYTSATGSSTIRAGIYQSIAPIGNFTTVVMMLHTDMTTFFTFSLSGLARSLSVGSHKFEPDGAGCLKYYAGKFSDTQKLDSGFERLNKMLSKDFSRSLDWRDVRVCPATDTTVALVLHGQAYMLHRVSEVQPVVTTSKHPSRITHQTQNQRKRATKGKGSIAELLVNATYENVDPILGFTKVTFTVSEGLLCFFDFYFPEDLPSRKIGPYRMAVDVLSGCLKYDTSDHYRKVAWEFYALFKSVTGDEIEHISASGVSLCFTIPKQAELFLGTGRYRMATPGGRDAGDGSHLATTGFASIDAGGNILVPQIRSSSLATPALQPPAGVYQNISSILGFTKVMMTVTAGPRCSLKLSLPWRVEPVSVRPLGMIYEDMTSCFVFDTRDRAKRLKVRWAFKKLADELEEKGFEAIEATDVKVCYSQSSKVELCIVGIRYPMTLITPERGKSRRSTLKTEAKRRKTLHKERSARGANRQLSGEEPPDPAVTNTGNGGITQPPQNPAVGWEDSDILDFFDDLKPKDDLNLSPSSSTQLLDFFANIFPSHSSSTISATTGAERGAAEFHSENEPLELWGAQRWSPSSAFTSSVRRMRPSGLVTRKDLAGDTVINPNQRLRYQVESQTRPAAMRPVSSNGDQWLPQNGYRQLGDDDSSRPIPMASTGAGEHTQTSQTSAEAWADFDLPLDLWSHEGSGTPPWSPTDFDMDAFENVASTRHEGAV
ncbi:hypothetical protein FOZ62_024303 [Perkinsus olseni]|uniref:Uncharacterized protein n=1 Tax=Perkinsus olseni TaxID=32597 RepID=A0A7J6UGQ1_PEROL|nr:hypothetical protein FOZ62_024303 [Perkinsus olseni]